MSPNISVHGKLTDKQINDLKSGVIQVSGKAMNRTALGVVDAMFKLYPNATFDEMKAMLPDSINPAAPVNFKSLFRPHTDRMYGVIQPASISGECEKQGLDVNSSHFTGPDETFQTSDGVKVLVSKCWQSKDTETGENNLQSLIDHVAQYGVKVVKFDKRDYFKKGGYDIEVLNPVLMNVLTEEGQKRASVDKKSKAWIVILLAALLAGLFLIFFLKNNENSAMEIKQDHVVAEQPEIDEVLESGDEQDIHIDEFFEEVDLVIDPDTEQYVEVDTAIAIEELREDIASGISTESRSIIFHNILFEYDRDIILHESESDLLMALSLLNDFQDISIQIVGHTCNIGTREYNNELSLKRAKSVANYFIDNGISVTRIKTSGQGMDNPIVENADELSRSKNRRIEIIVTKGMHDET